MASSRDLPQSSPRQFAHRGPPTSSNAAGSYGSPLSTSASNAAAGSGLASRTPHARNSSSHTHSIIGAALNSTHRVNRRKSMNSAMNSVMSGTSASTAAAVAAAMSDPNMVNKSPLSNPAFAAASYIAAKRGAQPKINGNTLSTMNRGTHAMSGATLPSPPGSLPNHRSYSAVDGSAIDDELNDMSDGEIDPAGAAVSGSSAARRASDGRRSSRMELRCRKCGKSYKHSSCLNKHLWEHTPEWALTSRLLISKHQQVQLLEAASVLVAMQDKPEGQSDSDAAVADTPPDSGPSSIVDDDVPHFDDMTAATTPGFGSGSAMTVDSESSVKRGPWSPEPLSPRQMMGSPSFGRSNTGHEDNMLAEGLGMLSCSANSERGHAHSFANQHVPPVPSVPTQYLEPAYGSPYSRNQSLAQSHPYSLGDTGFISSFPSGARESFTRGDHRRSSAVDTRKSGSVNGSTAGEDDEDRMSRARSDDDEDGVFGSMDE